MSGITPFGFFHTLISLAAVAAGIAAFVRHGGIGPRSTAGVAYIWLTIATCATGFFIFRHGEFGPPHALGIVTLLVLAVAYVAGRDRFSNGIGRYVETVAYSTTFFFHMIPGLTETFTRLPSGSPLFAGPDDPKLMAAIGACFVLFLIGATVQVVRLRGARRRSAADRTAPGHP